MPDEQVAWVTEQPLDPRETPQPGWFDCSWQVPMTGEFGDGPTLESLDEALAWARDVSDHVVVRIIGGQQFSAGRLRAHRLPHWPPPDEVLAAAEGRRRRERRRFALEMARHDPPAEWTYEVWNPAVEDVAGLVAGLEALPHVVRAGTRPDRHSEDVRVHVVVRAATEDEARQLGGDAFDAVLGEPFPLAGEDGEIGPHDEVEMLMIMGRSGTHSDVRLAEFFGDPD